MRIRVEEPHKPDRIITLDEAMEAFQLDEVDVGLLRDGSIVWYKDIALSRDENE